MKSILAKQYYSKQEVQKALLKFAKDREVGTCFDGFYGKRPDVLEYLSDVQDLIKKNVLSFHFSEERWSNPLLLGNNLSEEEKNKNRVGWDLILDLDGIDFFYAKIVGKIIIDYLTELGIKNVSTKFSGNKGFHIGIPFEAFSKKIGLEETRTLFPDIARKVATYLMFELKDKITKTILEHDKSVENISKKYNIPIKDLLAKRNGKLEFDYMKVIEVDTILISSRHLFRAPYSLNEKSGYVSIPIRNDRIMEFEKDEAKPFEIEIEQFQDFEFLRYNPQFGTDGDILLVKALDADIDAENIIDRNSINEIENRHKMNVRANRGKIVVDGNYEYAAFDINEEVNVSEFPKTIQFILNSKFSDGRKRALFVLLTYLYAINWQKESIKESVNLWNNIQDEMLKENYISAQINWFENQDKKISPPNYNNDNYYKSIGVPMDLIEGDVSSFAIKAKNPLHHTFLMLENKKTKQKKNKDTE